MNWIKKYANDSGTWKVWTAIIAASVAFPWGLSAEWGPVWWWLCPGILGFFFLLFFIMRNNP